MLYDILIIGSGGAGLSAALHASKSGVKVVVVSEGYPTRSQTCMAQGGINAALANMDDDSISSHVEDTIASSKELGSSEMIKKLCGSAIDSIDWLESIGVPFSRTKDNKIAQRRLGGASHQRACYSQDYTGLKILHTLYDQSLKDGIEFLNERFLVNLSVENNIVNGATFLNIRNTQLEYIQAKTVIMATGGYSAIYYGFTTNTNQSTGDGISAALRAGAKISNMEFMQFHPTGLKNSGILISESARGAGGYLVNQHSERFIDELKPRDEVSRAIYAQIKDGNEVFLDIRHLGEEFIDENIPQERRLAITYEGVDPLFEMIPIAPVAHYSMGGIVVDDDLMSSIDGLFAVGECSNSRVHGANRLGGNSLLEIIVFGSLCGKNAAKFANSVNYLYHDEQLKKDENFIDEIYNLPNKIDFYQKREFLGKSFYQNAGILREDKKLKALLSDLKEMQRELALMGIFDQGKTYNTNLIEFIKFGNVLELSEVILIQALERRESRGAHYREDFPVSDNSFARDSIFEKVVK